MALRFDKGTIGELRRTPHGGVIVPAAVTRVGVFPYRTADGKVVRELRHPEDVFAPESLATLANAVVTDRHPPELVTPENHRTYARGHVVGEAKHDARYVNADLAISDAELIRKVESGDAAETSCGYRCTYDEEPGVYDGEPYDRRQRNIAYNHIGLGQVGWGRAGRDVALRLDSDSAVLEDESSRGKPRRTGEYPVKKKIPTVVVDNVKKVLRLDDVDYPIDSKNGRDLAARALTSAIKRTKEMLRFDEMDLAAAQAAAADLMASLETFSAQVTALVDMLAQAPAPMDATAKPAEEPPPAKPAEEPAAKTDAADIDARVNARLALLERARGMHRTVKTDGRTDVEIMLDVIKHVDPAIKFDGDEEKDPVFVRAAFKTLRPINGALGRAHGVIVEGQRSDGDEDPVAVARAKNREHLQSAWRTPTTAKG